MADQKHPAARSSERPLFPSASTNACDDTALAKKSKSQVAVTTFERWQRNFNQDCQTLTWLRCDTEKEDKNPVSLLWCSACREYMYRSKICSMKNYSQASVTGSTNHRTSNVLDHVGSDQHKSAMSHLHTAKAKASNQPVTSYAPIMRALTMLKESERGRMRCKFDMGYLMAKEGITFEKYKALCELEARHNVDLGSAYRTDPSAKLFTHYIKGYLRKWMNYRTIFGCALYADILKPPSLLSLFLQGGVSWIQSSPSRTFSNQLQH